MRTLGVVMSLALAACSSRHVDDRDGPTEVPERCRAKLPRYFESQIRDCARAEGKITVGDYHIEESSSDWVEGWVDVTAGDRKIEVNFGCRRKALIGWFPASASIRRR